MILLGPTAFIYPVLECVIPMVHEHKLPVALIELKIPLESCILTFRVVSQLDRAVMSVALEFR